MPEPDQPAPATTTTDTAGLAADVALHLERWYQQRELQLPAEVQAEFARMGVEAVLAHPGRPRGEVLDELVAELDQRLHRIRGEPGADGAGADTPMPASKPRGIGDRLRRLFGR